MAKPRAETWIGARVPAPLIIEEDGGYRPVMTLWMQHPEGLILFVEVEDPRRPMPFGETLLAAMAKPAAGGPRQPQRVRVAVAELAAEVRRVAPGTFVQVAPTPEIQDVLRSMVESGAFSGKSAPESYLADGVSAETVAELFIAATVLQAAAPWRHIDGDLPLGLDVPALGLNGACISILGNAGEAYGFLLFESAESFDAFVAAAAEGDDALDFGGKLLSFEIDKRADVDPERLREVEQNRWALPNADRVPIVTLRDRDGLLLPVGPHEYDIATRVAVAVASFFLRRSRPWDPESDEPVSESFVDEDEVEVRLSLPYEGWDDFEPETEPRSDGPLAIDAELYDALLERLDGAEETAERMYELIEKDEDLQVRLGRSSRDFFQQRSLAGVPPQLLQEALARMVEWFACEHRDRTSGLRPFEILEKRLRRTAVGAAFVDKMQRSVVDVFAVQAVDPGNGAILEGVHSRRRFDLFAPEAEGLVDGALLVGRLFPLDARFWGASSRIIELLPPIAARFRRAFEESLRDRASDEPLSQRDLEAMLMDAPGPEADGTAAPPPARNAPCPCGSGKWYKRCCGR